MRVKYVNKKGVDQQTAEMTKEYCGLYAERMVSMGMTSVEITER